MRHKRIIVWGHKLNVIDNHTFVNRIKEIIKVTND